MNKPNKLNEVEQLVDVCSGYGQDALFDSIPSSMGMLRDAIGKLMDIEVPDDYDDEVYQQVDALSWIAVTTRLFKGCAQQEQTEKLELVRTVARRAAAHIGESFFDRTADERIEIVDLLTNNSDDDVSDEEYNFLNRIATAMICSYLLEG